MCIGSRRDGSGWVKGCAKNMGFAVRQLWEGAGSLSSCSDTSCMNRVNRHNIYEQNGNNNNRAE